MATIYKEINSTIPVVLDAPVFADDIQIHPGHRLRDCTRWQWFHDNLAGDITAITMANGYDVDATNEMYTVELDSVARSGEYYAEISIGTTGECNQTSRRERISIVSCGTTTATGSPFAHSGGTGSVTVEHAHFETVTLSAEGLDWVTNLVQPTQCLTEPGACISVGGFTTTQNSGSEARRGQVSMTVGDFVCYYNVVSNYQPAVVPAEEPDPAPGPFINLSQNGPATIGNVTVTATVGTIGGDGSETYTVDWSDDRGGEQEDTLTYLVGNPDGFGIGDTVVTATVTDNNMLTATSVITVTHEQIRLFATSVTGGIIGQLGSIAIWGQDPITTTSGTITVSGGGVFFARMLIVPVGYLQGGEAGNFQATLTIDGPGASRTEVINSTGVDTATREIEFNGNGTYTWSYAWTDGISRPTGGQSIQPSASVLFAAQLF